MPLYEYECHDCGRRFEIIQKLSDRAVETCPSCGGTVRKLQSAPAFQFKGTGWYVTDYAKKGQPEASAKGDGDEAKTAKDQTPGKKDEAAKSATPADSGTPSASSTKTSDSST
jgi:putative FmdB family regulatory protein